MRYVSGGDLRSVLKAQRRLSPAQALPLVDQTARALDSAHQHGLVHRDVKPANILVQRGADGDPDHVYLADFGISKHALSRSGLTPTGQLIGSVDYIAPEQIQGQHVDERADIYSLGCVLYEVLTGRVPFVKDADAAVIWAHVEEQPLPPSRANPGLPPELDDVVFQALAKDPDDRFQTGRALVEAARAALGHPAQPSGSVLSASFDPSLPVPGEHRERPPASAPGLDADQAADHRGPPDRGRAKMVPGHGSPRPGRSSDEEHLGDGGSSEPAQSSSQRGRSWLPPAMAAAAVALIAAAAYFGLSSTGDGSGAGTNSGAAVSPSTSSSEMPSMTPSMTPSTGSDSTNPILVALRQANGTREARTRIPPATCQAKRRDLVFCVNPYDYVTRATFHTFPSLPKLYQAYQTTVSQTLHGPFVANHDDCSSVKSSGEVSWDHNYKHHLRYSVAEVEGDRLNPATQAAGRVFCTLDANSVMHIVWVQNAGELLGTADGSPHDELFDWWHDVHHNISFPGSGMRMG